MREMRRKGLSSCEERSLGVKFKKKSEGALLAWILAHCKRFVRRSTPVFAEPKMPCSIPLRFVLVVAREPGQPSVREACPGAD
jgi:hypothetical protein